MAKRKNKATPLSQREQIRVTKTGKAVPPFQGCRLSRVQALGIIMRLVRKTPSHPKVRELIELFHIHAEELTERGVSYETVRSIERQVSWF